MGNRILTLDNLYQFFVEQDKTVNFSAKENKGPIVVATEGFFDIKENDMPGMLQLKLKVCHIDTNRNGSHISQANMEKALPTLKYRPILAYIHDLPSGEKDFFAHNMEIVENADGEEEINYLEKQVGCFTADEPWLEYDKKQDKTYVMAYAVVPEEYTASADIIRRKGGTKVSCELVIEELSYNAKEKYLDLTDFYFGGCTLLGSDEEGNEIGEGMLGSRADIADFCKKEPVFTYQDKLIEVLDKLNITLSNFNINQSEEKGGNEEMEFDKDVVETVAEGVEIELEEVAIETEEVTGEAAETAEEGIEIELEEVEVVEETSEEEVTIEETPASEDDGGEQVERFTKTFTVELSHDDIRYALYNLIGVYEEEDNEWYGIYAVYDSYFVMQGWMNGKFFKQGYAVEGENVSLSGDRQEVFMMLLTESEKLEIEDMRSNYSALKEFKDNYDVAQVRAQKTEVLGREEYADIAETEDFKALTADMDKFSVEELTVKCDLMYAAHEKAKRKTFAQETKDKKPMAIMFGVNAVDTANEKPYGDLWK